MARRLGRRDFLSHAALTGFAVGLSPASALARQFPAVDTHPFAPNADAYVPPSFSCSFAVR